MHQSLPRRKSLPRILPQQTRDKIHSIIALTDPSIALKSQGISTRRILNLRIGRAIEGRVPGEEDVGNYSYRPYIAGFVVFAFQEFGRHVVRRSDGVAHRSRILLMPSR